MGDQVYTGYVVLGWDRVAGRAWFVGRRETRSEATASAQLLNRDPLAAGEFISLHVRDNVVTWVDMGAWSLLPELREAGECETRSAGPGTYGHTDYVLPFALLDLDASRARSAQLHAHAFAG